MHHSHHNSRHVDGGQGDRGDHVHARGIIVTSAAGLLYLNWVMQRLGGEDRVWAKLCALVERPYGKGVLYIPIECAAANPAAARALEPPALRKSPLK